VCVRQSLALSFLQQSNGRARVAIDLLGSPTSSPTNATGYPFAMTLRQVGSYQSWTYGAVRSMLLVATAQEPSRGRPHEQNSRHRRQ